MDRPDLGKDIEQMTAYCTYCPKMCRFSCPAASAEGRETVTPWGMMRLLELSRDGSVPMDSDVADAFFHCTGCRRCQSFCRHENDVPRALWEARKWVAEYDFLPPVYREMKARFDAHHTGYEAPPTELDLSPFEAEGTIGFWPDCATARHQPELVGALGRLIKLVTGESVRLIQSPEDHPPCCGFPLTGAGLEEAEEIRDKRWPSLAGLTHIYTDCPALAAWHSEDSSWQQETREGDPVFAHIYFLLAKRLPELPRPTEEKLVSFAERALHESCFVARQIDGLDPVATIVECIASELPAPLPYHGKESPCCGGRLHYKMLEPEAAEKAAGLLLETMAEGQEHMVTTESMCCRNLQDAAGKDSASSLLEYVCKAYDCI